MHALQGLISTTRAARTLFIFREEREDTKGETEEKKSGKLEGKGYSVCAGRNVVGREQQSEGAPP